MNNKTERLKALDADHFWFDGVLIDLNQLRHQELLASRDYVNFTDLATHAIGQLLNALSIYARDLVKGAEVRPIVVGWSLTKLNKIGIATGWREP